MSFKEKFLKLLENIGMQLIVLIIIGIGAVVLKEYRPKIEMVSLVQSVVPYWTNYKSVKSIDSGKQPPQLLSVTIFKHQTRRISIQSIEVIPCYEISHITSIPPDSVTIEDTAFSKEDSQESRTGKKCVFKGLKELPAGDVTTKIFFWGKFGYESEIDVSLNSPDLDEPLDAKKARYLTGIKLFIGEYLEWLLISSVITFFLISLYKRAKK